MSLVHEALKKIEKEERLKKNFLEDISGDKYLENKISKARKTGTEKKNFFLYFLIGVLTVLLSVFIYLITQINFSEKLNADFNRHQPAIRNDNISYLSSIKIDGKIINDVYPLYDFFPDMKNRIICSGIFCTNDDAYAVINGDIVRPGEYIANIQVIYINADYVIFRYRKHFYYVKSAS